MKTNADLSVYNKYLDPATKLDRYQRTVIRGIFWSDVEASARVQTGRDIDDSAYINIPMTPRIGATYVKPAVFQSLTDKTDYFTFAPEDRVVRGECDFEITGRVSDLDKEHEAYTITSVATRDYGSRHLQHWMVTVK